MGTNSAGERELFEESLQARNVLGAAGVDFRVGAFEVGLRENSGGAVACGKGRRDSRGEARRENKSMSDDCEEGSWRCINGREDGGLTHQVQR